VALQYNEHCATLDEARKVFRDEINNLNTRIFEELSKYCNSEYKDRLRWGSVEEQSTAREGAWLSYWVGSNMTIDLKQAGNTRYTKGSAKLSFEIAYDWDEHHQYMFQAYFLNHNTRGFEEMDETIVSIIEELGKDDFPNHTHVKSDKTIIFQYFLTKDNDLFNTYVQHVEKCIKVCQLTLDRMFPDLGEQEAA
ncbi:MAG: hypothetical protein OEZ58_09905, partial [Gammaproteobacteria bacterium]|nr:hypothetical protein [Gammaproteobacteria bacterium]